MSYAYRISWKYYWLTSFLDSMFSIHAIPVTHGNVAIVTIIRILRDATVWLGICVITHEPSSLTVACISSGCVPSQCRISILLFQHQNLYTNCAHVVCWSPVTWWIPINHPVTDRPIPKAQSLTCQWEWQLEVAPWISYSAFLPLPVSLSVSLTASLHVFTLPSAMT